MKILVVGGVAGGATAIARLRRLDEDAQIILLERGKYVSFANCGLPYYVGGTIANRDALFVSLPEDIEAKYGIEIRTENEVKSIDKEKKTVTIYNHKNGSTYAESYDKLLLSTGSRPFVPPVQGVDGSKVFSLWTIPDVDKITHHIETTKPKKAVVVGGGFIGLEMAENLVDRGIEVTLVEMAPQVMPPVDEDMARIVENHMARKGVKLMLGKGFNGTENDGGTVLLNIGEKIDTDMVILSIGVRPNNELAKEAGLSISERGGVVVDAYMQTSDPHIYAVGDVISVEDYVLGGPTMIPLAGPANKQGRAVGANMLGKKKESYHGTMGTSVAKIFDLTVAAVGSNEKILARRGLVYKKDYFVSLVHPMSHAGYYPGAGAMTIKLIYAADGKVLGAQIVGYDGVDKRIDTIATTMHFRGTVDDLSQLELAYAPPYNSAKDPVNFAGFTAMNALGGLTSPVLYREYAETLGEDKKSGTYTLLDIREKVEVQSGKVAGSLHIPLTELRKRHTELDKTKHYLVFCAVGLRGYIAERILKQKGFRVSNLLGGYRTLAELGGLPPLQGADSGQDRLAKSAPSSPSASSNATAGAESASTLASESARVASGVTQTTDARVEVLNVCGMSCPGPIVQVSKAMGGLSDGDVLEVVATDPGFARDIESWCINTCNTLLGTSESKGQFQARIRKGNASSNPGADAVSPCCGTAEVSGGRTISQGGNCCNGISTNSGADGNSSSVSPAVCKEKTMIVFDGDLDKAIASFIIATGAAAMGNKVHMFFTFWGLSILRKQGAEAGKKDFMSRMFGAMLPKSSRKLGLSKMNFMGMGPKMIRSVMKKKGVSSLEDLIKEAQELGVEMTACQMSMDVMGITKEELIDGVNIGGVATMLHDSDKSNMNLFI